MALKLIKNKIKSTERTSKVTKAMEAVSAVKMRKSQERAFEGRPYALTALHILERVVREKGVVTHVLANENRGTRTCVIVVTSDKGLAGNLNGAVLKMASELLKEHATESVSLICVGKKAYEYFERRGYKIDEFLLNVSDEFNMEDIEHIAHRSITGFTSHKYKNVYIVYQNFISTFEQRATARKILPLTQTSLRTMVEEIVPRSGKYSDIETDDRAINYTVEPDRESVYDSLFPLIITIMVYHALLESKASEHSARMIAMKNATDKAKEMIRSLTLSYNKERQSVITAEVSEITGGIEAMKLN